MGEKPIRCLKDAGEGRVLRPSIKRVKVYRLEDDGRWADQGTGHVTIDYIQGSRKCALAVMSEDDNEILLLHKITPHDIYKKEETIISWRDPEKALELAVSFDGPAVCSYIWETMCSIQEDLQSKILCYKSLSSVNGELKNLSLFESFPSRKRKCSRHLPPVELSSFLAVLKNVQTILQCGFLEQMGAVDSVPNDKDGGAAQEQVINMVPARPMSLDDLPVEMLEEVVRRLPCRADRARLRCCNHFWKDSMKNFSEPLQLPWLLLPSTVELLYYTVTGDRFRNFRPIPTEIRNARFVGASDGDWLFLVSDNPHKQQIFHLFSGQSIWLPTTMMMESRQVNVTLISAVLSSDPSDGGFMVAAIVSTCEGGHKRAAFWRKNMLLWGDCGNVALQRAEKLLAGVRYLPLDMELEDLVHINGVFWYLTSEEELIRLIPTEDINHQLRMVVRGLNMQIRNDFEPGEELDEDEAFQKGEGELTRRYLVESSGQPIMIVRTIQGHLTVGLQVFRVLSDGDNMWWDELFELPGETLFVGHGCSRSYKIGQELLKVYFFHDRITRHGGRNLYWRTDCGIATRFGILEWPVLWWDGRPVPASSDRAPPIWVLH